MRVLFIYFLYSLHEVFYRKRLWVTFDKLTQVVRSEQAGIEPSDFGLPAERSTNSVTIGYDTVGLIFQVMIQDDLQLTSHLLYIF